MGEWNSGICGCFNHCGLCIVSYFLPCYRVGKIAETLGEDFLCNCLMALVPILNIIIMMGHRGTIRERQGIEGTTVNDLVCVLCCPLCSLTQEAVECQVMTGGAMVEQDIERC